MARRKRSETSKRQSAMSYGIVMLGMVVVCVFLAYKIVDLNAESKVLDKEKAALERQIEEEKQEHERLVQTEQYMQTNDYIVDVAKNKLGLVFPYEIVIKPNE